MPRVLIVDDEPGIRFALKRWFERQQWAVLEASDGQSAVDLLLSSADDTDARLDVVVCDLHLPVLSGEAIVQTLQQERPALARRVLLTTGDTVIDAEPDSILARHPHVLQKPFDLGTLKAVVDRIAQAGLR
ncbi:response regulator [Gemmatimonas sp.]|uniref:response regulator n=1 Tax=Gemmatimonas sp. TaxID=1962908 RepID=UPI003DA69C9E